MLIIDSNPEAFLARPQNALPILPFTSGSDDYELPKLTNYLSSLANEKDVAKVNCTRFKINKLSSAYNEKEALSFVVPNLK